MDDPTVANQFEPAGSNPAQPPAAGPTKTVCIEMSADGTFKVGLEPPEPTPAPGMGETESPATEGAEEDAMKPAGSIDEALQMARQLLEGDQPSAEDQAMAGYNSGKRNMPSGGMGVGKVFGEG